MIKSWVLKSVLAGLALSLFSGCAMPLKTAETANVADGKMIVVGRVILAPELTEAEKEGQVYIHKLHIAAEKSPLREGATTADIGWFSMIEAEWGKPFFVEVDAKPLYLTAARTFTNFDGKIGSNPLDSEVWFPAGFKVNPKAGAKAIYIGTVIYTRDEFWVVKDVDFKDEFKVIEAEFKKKYGADAKLDKSLIEVL